LEVELNHYNFAETSSFEPVKTSRDGVYVCGSFRDCKDIPISVMEASAAAAAAATPLVEARNTMTTVKELPPERSVAGEEPRVGVFVCNCGINIGGVADVPAVAEYAKTLPKVVFVTDNLFTCSQDTQQKMREIVEENKLNRVVVAACSPRTHEPLFQETIREVGLNPYLFEMANIRDQNTWVHQQDKEAATAKAKDLVRMAVARALLLDPLQPVTLGLNKSALVVGGGVAGMVASLTLADQGFPVQLVEMTDQLGGNARKLRLPFTLTPKSAAMPGLWGISKPLWKIETTPGKRIRYNTASPWWLPEVSLFSRRNTSTERTTGCSPTWTLMSA
jgi:heterodisulfide reductase subunit A-like polyferredoxin